MSGLAKSGVLVRHLAMPGYTREGEEILTWLAELSTDMYVNIMEQYRPTHKVGKGEKRARGGWDTYQDIDRQVEEGEMERLTRHAREKGLWRFEDMVPLDRPSVPF